MKSIYNSFIKRITVGILLAMVILVPAKGKSVVVPMPPPHIIIEGCGSSTLAMLVSETDPYFYYWQSSASGTSTQYRDQRTTTVPGTFYARTYDPNSDAWSNAVSATVSSINSSPPSGSPATILRQVVNAPGNVTFTFPEVTNATSYAWYTDAALTQKIYGESSNSLTVLVDQNVIYYVTAVNACAESTATKARAVIELPGDPNLNWVRTKGFDESGVVFTESKAFFGLDGKALQSQTKNFEANQVLASQGLEDEYGRDVLSSLAAPINKSDFQYQSDFITDVSGEAYNHSNFGGTKKENPDAVGSDEIGTLGWYYSDNNTFESRVPATSYPYSRTDFYEDGSGEVKRAAQPGEKLRMGAGHESITKTLPMGDDELPHYKALRKIILGPQSGDNLDQTYKQINIDPNGKESVAYIGESGDAIATALALSAGNIPFSKDFDGEIEIHIPNTGTDVQITVAGSGNTRVYDKMDEGDNALVELTPGSSTTMLSPGIYRLWGGGDNVSYTVGYSHHAYNFYDNAGRLAASIAPNGLVPLMSNLSSLPTGFDEDDLTFTTFYTYDFQGRLIKMEEPDAGTTTYVYRKDGSIRFSQNAQQAISGKYSYTSYDQSGRPIESGEYNGSGTVAYGSTEMTNMLEDTGIDFTVLTQKGDWVKTVYDFADSRMSSISELVGYTQDYLYGAVSYTENENVITRYSYDEFGQVTWIAMEYIHLSNQIFTIDYQYDYFGNVTEVAFQKNEGTEAFYHHYTYDKENRLSAVYTSLNGNFDLDANGKPTSEDAYLHAKYFYYMHGPLKRVEYAEDLQGIDYTYTAQGWLKSINNPIDPIDNHDNVGTVTTNKDAFGMSLDYYMNDYQRANTNIASLYLGTAFEEQYGGNIKTQHWGRNFMGVLQHYEGDIVLDEYDPSNKDVIAGNSITLAAGFNSDGGDFSTTIDPDATYLPPNEADNIYAYSYDEKYQLKEAIFGENEFTYDFNNAVNDITYDANGNILTLKRYDKDAIIKDNFAYNYTTNNSAGQPTNMLTSVGTYADYNYNEIGQMTASKNRAGMNDQYMKYDVTGKVVGVYSDSNLTNAVFTYEYDDRGFRILKKDVAKSHETWYVRDASGNIVAIYEKDGSAAKTLKELPIYGASKIGTSFRNTLRHKYNYELTDHLGNVRAIVSKLKFMETATMEDDRAAYEESLFVNVSETRQQDLMYNSTYNGSKSARLNGAEGRNMGPAISLTVNAGDIVKMDVYAKYDVQVANQGLISNLFAILSGGFGLGAGSGENPTAYNALNAALSGAAAVPGSTGDAPKAYLQYILFDKDYNTGTVLSGYQKVTEAADGEHECLALEVTVPTDGYIYIYVANESSLNKNVYFDDLTVRQLGVDITQTTDYYPFGSVMNHWESANNDKYRFGYQGEFAEKDEETGYNHFEAREFDSRIGRWMIPDPAMQHWSPYLSMSNNPVNRVDPDGEFDGYQSPKNGWQRFWNNLSGFGYLNKAHDFLTNTPEGFDIKSGAYLDNGVYFVGNEVNGDGEVTFENMIYAFTTDGIGRDLFGLLDPRLLDYGDASDYDENVILAGGGGKFGWIKKSLYQKLWSKAGQTITKQFTSALTKGLVGPEGKSGIKELNKAFHGKFKAYSKYTHELKINGKARLLGRADENGVILFDKFLPNGLH